VGAVCLLVPFLVASGATGAHVRAAAKRAAGLPPALRSAPTVSGTAQDRRTLIASPGTWSNSPTSYAYQ
jgi:predicted HAD superfamily phosphohydrolase